MKTHVIFLLVGFCAAFTASRLHAEQADDLTKWNTQGSVQTDATKPGPGGGASIRIKPGAKAVLKLRDTDGSGKVSFYVYDDGKVAMPARKRSVGPRWGTMSADGRVFLGGVMYDPHLHAEGSLCYWDTDPSQDRAWMAFKYLSPRGEAGWKKWEFDYDPDTGLTLVVNGKPVAPKYFNWNASKATGFNGLVLYGDDAQETPQTIWVSDVKYELGPPMKVKPGSLPTLIPAPPVPKGPAPEEETEKSTEPPVVGKMSGFVPGPTLLDDLKNLKVPLVAGYASRHPRLLFSVEDRQALQKRARDYPELWDRVVKDAKSISTAASVPDAGTIQAGSKYYTIVKVESAALIWFVTGDPQARDGAIRWMVAHCKEGVWGTNYRPNLDLVASYYLYYLSIAYDILKDELTPDDRALVTRSLAEHARAIYLDFDPHDLNEKIRYDQNHTYTPTVALSAAALALMEDVPEAKYWLTRSYAVLRRCRYVQSEDGYYYEGFGYWTYALHWHVRGAELLTRATGENLFALPVLRDSWLYGLHLGLPGTPKAFDVGDGGKWVDGKRADTAVTNASMLWKIASQTGSARSRLVGDIYDAAQPETVYPSSAFLWFDPDVKPATLAQVEPFHYFPDHDVIAWRSNWTDDATCYLFRSGPPLGHKAVEKFGQLKDWTMNAGHVHPDIGAFWMYAKGAYLAVGTGYTAEKWTKDHNTLLIDGKGQGVDGSYNNDRGVPYDDFDKARIDRQFLSPEYGYASGEFGQVYRRQVSGVRLRRSLLMTERWLLVIDDMDADEAHRLTWVCHADAPFEPQGPTFLSRQAKASLAVIPLGPDKLDAQSEPSVVMAGKSPGKGTPEARGFQLHLTSPQAGRTIKMMNLLVPLGEGEQPPTVQPPSLAADGYVVFDINWPTGRTEHVRLNANWQTGNGAGPAEITRK